MKNYQIGVYEMLRQLPDESALWKILYTLIRRLK